MKITTLLGYKWQQRFFEKLETIALVGMNVGRGGDLNESGESSVLNHINREGLVVFDVGANKGDYSRALKQHLSNPSVYSFEPSASAFHQLKEVDGIHSYNVGMSDKAETIAMYADADGSGLGSVYERNLQHFNTHVRKIEDVKLTTIDAFCADHGIKKIDFLKIDVEGHELKVLQGAKTMLGSIQYIQFEFGGCDIDSKTFFKDFWYLLKDFNIFRIVKDGLYPIAAYRESYERFLNTNFFAERKTL